MPARESIKYPVLSIKQKNKKTPQAGFTLIELMVTIAIIAILSAVGIVVYSSAQKTGRMSKRSQDLVAIKTALELYKTSTGSYPAQNGWACISSALTVLTPNYMPVLPSDPLDSNGAVTNCYEYTTGAAGGVTTEYKVRTNATIAAAASGPEMSSANFAQQPTLIDPATDGTANCVVETIASGAVYKNWAVSSGSTVCDD